MIIIIINTNLKALLNICSVFICLSGNAEQINDQQHVLVTNWNTLQEHATQRRQLLQAANDYQRLMATVRNLAGFYRLNSLEVGRLFIIDIWLIVHPFSLCLTIYRFSVFVTLYEHV